VRSSAESPNAGLTIGLDARAATEVKAGRGRVVRELLVALAKRSDPHAYRCYARIPWQEPLNERFVWISMDTPDPLWHAQVAARANAECDVFLSSNSYLTVPLLRIPAVAVVHDLIAFNRAMRPNRRSSAIERLTLGPAVRRAAALWCTSQATADALLERYPAARGKVNVIPLAVAPSLARQADGEAAELPSPGFVLAVGTLEPRKNLPRLVAAYASLPLELQQAHPLVVAGAHGWSVRPTIAALASLGNRCILLGHVSDAALSELYGRCAVFCYPSLGEGFGLPVLEAMAAGAPVLTSRVSSLPEVGGDAVEYCDPESQASIGDGLRRLLDSPVLRSELSRRATKRAVLFSWDRTATDVVEMLERVGHERAVGHRSASSR
jgi:glycosyltransferase involved in cell wall biosynthesis